MVKKATKKAAGRKAAIKTKAKKRSGPAKRSATSTRKILHSVNLQHSLDALLHTMRCIAQHEDELCTLLHDARKTGRISAALLRELRAILQELPGEEYLGDLYAVQQTIEETFG